MPKQTEQSISARDQQVTVILPNELTGWLDQLALDLTTQHGLSSRMKPNRSELLRAFVAGVKASGLDLPAALGKLDAANLATPKGQATRRARGMEVEGVLLEELLADIIAAKLRGKARK